ncbi:putative sulfate exporter family transporter [Methylobacterium currus]|uniref:YeiH family protein n=1 Tax=Methylobacterium TaxID=407 RepID=UPI001E65DD90|nr:MULTISPECIES: putative sulfate exporter family transporter [Methylobacterium]MCF4124947.1 putative sulfate exporter family transporter [Methylobacterium sp. SyP6R]UHC19424.1 putative sulfate exporter family transporter [Methylobacterium currus]
MTAATLIASPLTPLRRLLPGLLLCLAVTGAALALESAEEHLFGRAWLEALVLAIVLGTALRTVWNPGARYFPGIAFGAKTVLEVAVVLLGASLSLATLLAAGPGLLVGIAVVVMAAIAASYGIGRALGLHPRLAILVACGNSICGNSAIAATAPVIGADGEDVASSIAFTAVLGVLVVLGLPLLVPLLGLSPMQYGVLAGLTVYAVPQVLAATAPVAALSVQVGTLVKLVRVLMLGPVVLALSLGASRLREETDEPAPHVTAGERPKPGRVAIHRLVPWFILAFLAMAGLRSGGLIPQAALPPIAATANVLTIVSMAALGLGVDVRSVAGAGLRVTLAVVASLLALTAVSLCLIQLLGIA